MDETPDLWLELTRVRMWYDQDLVDELQRVEAEIRALQAQRAVIVAVTDERIQQLGYRVPGTADEIALALAISPRSADHLLSTSLVLCDRAVVWNALAAGRVDLVKAGRILDLLADVPDPRREELERQAVEYAASHTAYQLKEWLLARTIDADPDETLRREAVDARGVWLTGMGHGMAEVSAYLSAEHAIMFYEALEKLAAAEDCPDPYEQGSQRTAEQRRADALTGLLQNTTVLDVLVDVTISADTLIGEDHRDALLGKHGAIPASLARYLAWSPDARWRRLVCEPLTGRLIDANAECYKVPERIKRVVRLRDRVCRFPGCTRPAEYTDTDHIVPWSKGGKTRAEDLAGECRRHHLVKTHSAWTVRHQPAVTTHEMTWTSPLGRTYTTTAYQYHRRQ